MNLSLVAYDSWNITAPWPRWNGEINWDGENIFTPKYHGIGFSETANADYNVDTMRTQSVIWDGRISFNGANFWGAESRQKMGVTLAIDFNTALS